jgi:hypothetical protein
MMQHPISDNDARSLAQKLSQFVESLADGERAAFEAAERQISMLIAVDDVQAETEQGDSQNTREALWYRLATG